MSRKSYPKRPSECRRPGGQLGRRLFRMGSLCAWLCAWNVVPAQTPLPFSKEPPIHALGEGDGDLPPPRPIAPTPLTPNRPGQPAPPGSILGTTPKAEPKTVEKIGKYIDHMVDPEATTDLIVGRTRLLILKETPKRIQVGNDQVFEYNFLGKDQMLLVGRNVGVTNMMLWFADPKDATKEELVNYYIRTLPDPEAKERLERVYKALQDQINCAFPDSQICLHIVGDKLVVTGQAKDSAEVTQILRIIRSNAPVPGTFGHSSIAKIPTDRQAPGPRPNDPADPAAQAQTPGVDNYLIDGASWIVNMIRIPGEQTVNLKVVIAEVSRAATRSIGVNFNLINNNGQTYFSQSTGSIATGGLTQQTGLGVSSALSGIGFIPAIPGVATGAGGFNNLPAQLDGGQVRLAISALRNLNYAKLLAEPNLTAMNGQTATFQAGGEFPLPVIAGVNTGFGLQGIQFRPYGVNVAFTPYITDRDRIRLVLDATVSAISQSVPNTNVGGSFIPNFNQRHVNTTVELREGQTLAVAGLIQNDNTAEAHRVPFFGDLPIIGRLAGFDRIAAGEQELVILVTPELVHPLDCKDKIGLPGSDIFEPTDIEYYLLGRLESHRQVNYRAPIRTDWQRIRNYRHMEANFIAGPSGYCEQ